MNAIALRGTTATALRGTAATALRGQTAARGPAVWFGLACAGMALAGAAAALLQLPPPRAVPVAATPAPTAVDQMTPAEEEAARQRIAEALAAMQAHRITQRLAQADAALASTLAAADPQAVAAWDARVPLPAADEPPAVAALVEPPAAPALLAPVPDPPVAQALLEPVPEPPVALAVPQPAPELPAALAAAEPPAIWAADRPLVADAGATDGLVVRVGVLRVPRPATAAEWSAAAMPTPRPDARPKADAEPPQPANAGPPAPPAPPATRAFVHHVASPDAARRLAGSLPDGVRLAEIRQVRAAPPSADVRFFFAADRAAAQALAQRLGMRLRDMSHYRPLPQPGTLEVWLPQS
jgi:hypothetical protein